MLGDGALAVKAAVCGAGAATLDQLLAQRGARAMGTDCGVASGDGLRRCVSSQALFRQVDFAKERGVGGGKSVERAGDALAGGVHEKRIGRGFCFELARPTIEGRAFRGAAAMVIDEGVAQDAVEPGDGGFILAQLAGRFERTDVGRLQDVFSERAIAEAAIEKAEELPAEIEKRCWDWICHMQGVGAGGSRLLPPGLLVRV